MRGHKRRSFPEREERLQQVSPLAPKDMQAQDFQEVILRIFGNMIRQPIPGFKKQIFRESEETKQLHSPLVNMDMLAVALPVLDQVVFLIFGNTILVQIHGVRLQTMAED